MSKLSERTPDGHIKLIQSEVLRRYHPVPIILLSLVPGVLTLDDVTGFLVLDQILMPVVIGYMLWFLWREGFWNGFWSFLKQAVRAGGIIATGFVFIDDFTAKGVANNWINLFIVGGLTAFNLMDVVLQRIKKQSLIRINMKRYKLAIREHREPLRPVLRMTPDQRRAIRLAEKAAEKHAAKMGIVYQAGTATIQTIRDFLAEEPTLDVSEFVVRSAIVGSPGQTPYPS